MGGSLVRSLWRRARRTFRQLIGRDPWHRVDINVSTSRIGSDYGGWTIIPEELDENSIIYSFGVGEDITFDLGIIRKYGATVHAFDPTPRVSDWLKARTLPDQFIFYPIGISSIDGVIDLYPPEDSSHISHSIRAISTRPPIEVPVQRLPTIMKTLGHIRIDIIKLDIEGSELSIIDDLINQANSLRQVLIEFHHNIINTKKETELAVSRLREAGFKIFHISDTGQEYSFLRSSVE